MVGSAYDDGSYPILINPTQPELAAWAEGNKWDTLRISAHEDWIGIASGMGNTHHHITLVAKKCGIRDYLAGVDLILFMNHGEVRWNLEHINGLRIAHFKTGLKELFTEEQVNIITDLKQFRLDQ